MRFRIGPFAMVAAMLTVTPAEVWAQDEPLAKMLVDLLVRAVSMSSTAAGVAGNPHEAHFLPNIAQQQAPLGINKALAAQLATFPIGSSSGGFVFNFDAETGLFQPASQSFGPGFAERALTNGRRRFGFGFNYQRLDFSSFEGIDLHNTNPSKNIPFVLEHNNCCPTPPGAPPGTPESLTIDPNDKNPFFEGDLVETSLSLHLKADMFAAFVNYGLSDRWDVGVVVPVVRISLNPSITSTIDRISTCPQNSCTSTNRNIHAFPGADPDHQTVTASSSATGLGDVVLRTKYRFMDAGHGGLAGGFDLRLPTGDKDNLLGTGVTQAKLLFIASTEFSRVAPHVNLGYAVSHGEVSRLLTTLTVPTGLPCNTGATVNYSCSGSTSPYQTIFATGTPASNISLSLPNEFSYSGGVDIAAHSLVTISGDLIGRALFDTQRFGIVAHQYNYRTSNGGTLQPTSRNAFDVTGTGTLNLLLGVVGAKVNIPGTSLLITGNVLFPLTNDGLRPNVTPVVGLDYSFRR